MLGAIARKWWLFLVKGICLIFLGIMAVTWPGIALWSLVILYGASALVDGVANVAMGISGGADRGPWWEMILLGLVSIIAGLIAVLWPGLTTVVLLIVIAAWAIVHGIVEIIGAIRLRKLIDDEWLLVLSGVLSIGFGVLLLWRPGAGALAVVLLIGGLLVATGIVSIALSLRLHGIKKKLEGEADHFGQPRLA